MKIMKSTKFLSEFMYMMTALIYEYEKNIGGRKFNADA